MDYKTVAQAKQLPGVKLVLTGGFPGPWGEAVKSLFYVKGIEYVPVYQEPNGANEELVAWSGYRNAPVVMVDDEPGKVRPEEAIFLAERLQPLPALLPADAKDRAWMFGLLRELTGELGLGWSRRHFMLIPEEPSAHKEPTAHKEPSAPNNPTDRLIAEYGHGLENKERSLQKMLEIVGLFDDCLATQQAKGHKYLIGAQFTALDIYWATFLGMLKPMDEALCQLGPMRPLYETVPDALAKALTPRLCEHRDYIYTRHLQLPMDF